MTDFIAAVLTFLASHPALPAAPSHISTGHDAGGLGPSYALGSSAGLGLVAERELKEIVAVYVHQISLVLVGMIIVTSLRMVLRGVTRVRISHSRMLSFLDVVMLIRHSLLLSGSPSDLQKLGDLLDASTARTTNGMHFVTLLLPLLYLFFFFFFFFHLVPSTEHLLTLHHHPTEDLLPPDLLVPHLPRHRAQLLLVPGFIVAFPNGAARDTAG